ncbi:MAG TPA: hypothetical protein VKH43_08170 [Thermoanaerobaculia bacterium]|nr:hypothetical protein [Thermoanaerobaculia bacterium]
MSVLYLDFPGPDRDSRTQKLGKTGAHIVPSDPRWPGFFELAKKEKPYAIVIDFEQAPSHSLETADYLAKAKETRDVAMYLLRVPQDRLDAVAKRLPQALVVSDQELSVRVTHAEREAQERARQKKEAAAAARKSARAKAGAAEKAASGAAAGKSRPAPKAAPKAAAKPKKPAAGARKPASKAKKAAGKSASRGRKG